MPQKCLKSVFLHQNPCFTISWSTLLILESPNSSIGGGGTSAFFPYYDTSAKITGEKNLWSTLLDYSMEYFWSTFGLLLDHFWSTHLSLVLMIVASIFSMEYFWTTFGLLWTTFGVPHLTLVLMTVASRFYFLERMLQAMHQQQEAPCRT